MAGPGDEIAAGKAGRGHLRASTRRPRAGDRHCEGGVRAGHADEGRARCTAGPDIRRADLWRTGCAHRRSARRTSRSRASTRPPGAPTAASQGGCRVGRLSGHRSRRRTGHRPCRSGPHPRRHPQVLGHVVRSHRPCRRGRSTWHPEDRGGRLTGAAALPPAAAASARTARPCPRRRTARRPRAWPGSPRPPARPDPHRPAGPQATTAPAAHSRPSGPGTPRH